MRRNIGGLIIAMVLALTVTAEAQVPRRERVHRTQPTVAVPSSPTLSRIDDAAPPSVAARPGPASVTLTWGAVPGATSYSVSRAPSADGQYGSLTASPITATEFTDSGLVSGATYYYRVSASQPDGRYGTSEPLAATPTAAPDPAQLGASPPQDGLVRDGSRLGTVAEQNTLTLTRLDDATPPRVTAKAGVSTVTLQWPAVDGANGYSVVRAPRANGEYRSLTASAITATEFTDAGLTPGETYYYRVSAARPDGHYGTSEPLEATPTANDPANFAANVAPDGSVTLKWDPVPGISWYLLGGPGVGLYGQRVEGTSYTVRGVGSGRQEWTVASLAGKDQPPLTNGAKWPKAVARLSIVGFADTHTHPFGNLAAGGNLFWGAAFGPIETALAVCNPSHGLGGTRDLIGNLKRTFGGHVSIGHHTGGYPHFDGWPSWNTLNHQQMYSDWIFRAYEGGLRLLVAHAVNNSLLCALASPGGNCDDMAAVDLQIAAAKQMESYIDSRSGGTEKGWFRIAYTPKHAREIIDGGKLAVVLGIEVDRLFRCGINECDPATVDRELARYYNQGVRHIIPVHFADNAFGGYALGGGSEKFLFGVNSTAASQGGLLTGTVPQEMDCSSRFAQKCNQRPLTSLGAHLIRSMMNRGMIIDIDHMGMRTTDAVLQLTSARQYPVIGGHTGFVGTAPAGKSSERDKSDQWLAAMRANGGMVSVGVTGGETRSHNPSWRGAVANNCPKTSKAVVQGYLFAVDRMGGPDHAAVGLATDQFLHEFTSPRFDGHCPGEANSTRVSYPVTTRTGKALGPSRAGNRTFDYNSEGLAHFGLLPELIQDLKNVGLTDRDLDPLFRSAEGYIRMWERAVAGVPVP